MEWNLRAPLRRGCGNLVMLTGKENEISKFTQQVEGRSEGGVVSNGLVCPSGSGTCFGSDLVNGSSRSSISASVGFSSKIGVKIPDLKLKAVEDFHGHLNRKNELAKGDGTGTSPVLVGSRGAGEFPVGLKLGKRIYFEDFGASNIKTSSYSASMTLPAASIKKSRIPHQANLNTYCQVEGCNIDLIAAKYYHRKHRVCETHSKSPKVIVNGHECRFCQQCSRFHDMSEFDQKKRSCRKRLFDHNARRRKPQPETISFNSSVFSSSFYDERQQMNSMLNRARFSHMTTCTSTLREESSGVSLSMTEGSCPKPIRAGVGGPLQLPSMDFSNIYAASHDDHNRIVPFKGTMAEVLNQGLEASISASNLNGALDLCCALSLLSNDSCGPSSTDQSNMIQFVSTNPNMSSNPAVHAASSSPECWQDVRSLHQQAWAVDCHSSGNQFQEFHLSKTPFESYLFDANLVFSKSDDRFLKFKT